MKPASLPVPQFQRIHPGSGWEWNEGSAECEQAEGTTLTLADGVTPQEHPSHGLPTKLSTPLAPQKEESPPLTRVSQLVQAGNTALQELQCLFGVACPFNRPERDAENMSAFFQSFT